MSLHTSEKVVEDIVVSLEVIEHPIEDVFSTVRELKNPNKETIRLYFEVYHENYSKDDINDLLDLLCHIQEIRSFFISDLSSLGVDVHENSFFRGLQNFINLLSEVRMTSSKDDEFYDSSETKERIISVHKDIKVCERENVINGKVYLLVGEAQNVIKEGLEGIDHEKTFSYFMGKLQNLIEDYSLHVSDSGGNDTDPLVIGVLDGHLNLPDLEGHVFLSFPYRTQHKKYHRLNIKKQLKFLCCFLSYLYKGKNFFHELGTSLDIETEKKIIEKDKVLYGAKGGYLRFLKRFVECRNNDRNASRVTEAGRKIKKITEMISTYKDDTDPVDFLGQLLSSVSLDDEDFVEHTIDILPSIEVDISLYQKWLAGEDIDGDLQKIYDESQEMLQGFGNDIRELIIRSSAVYSEDNEQTTGAGIYKSIGGVKSFSSFKKAVIQVFKSTDSKSAKDYRNYHKIEEEYMGLIVQPYIEIDESEGGYINSSRASKSHILDVKDNRGRTVPIDKDIFPIDIYSDYHIQIFESLGYNIDFDQSIEFPRFAVDMVYFAMIFERFFGTPIQTEFVTNSTDSGYIVQLRPIPEIDTPIENIVFPKITPIYEGKCPLVGDIIIKEDELYQRNSSYGTTEKLSIGALLRGIQNAGTKVVVISDTHGSDRGHIETLCMENGILCITDDPLSNVECNIPDGVPLRIISDGEDAKVYLLD